jgi:hypothetical protein
MRESIVYKNGGEDYLGRESIKQLQYWIDRGKKLGQKFFYKGYRWSDNKSDQVIVYTTEKWDGCEIEKRRANGFLGIREYYL